MLKLSSFIFPLSTQLKIKYTATHAKKISYNFSYIYGAPYRA